MYEKNCHKSVKFSKYPLLFFHISLIYLKISLKQTISVLKMETKLSI